MPTTVVSRRVQPLTAAAFAPLGWLPVSDTDVTDGENTLYFEWADPHLNVISHAASEIDHTERGAPLCTVLYRHATHTQALLVLNVDAVVACAPPNVTFSDPSDLDAIVAFRLRPLDTFVLHRGTWHWGPFPLGGEPVQLLNVQGRRYAEDNDSVDLFARTGAGVEVLP
ncbi:MAG TPA: ureidoglycolate lyase [Acidimicrobiia bacterium]|nr:ureidoglycolate lyase [Acidimicrobiia bacterium]